MESKLNHSAIESYSNSYAKKVSNEFFGAEEFINGNQILNLCPVKQVNFFVIKNLFQKWKKETDKLQSPYFDYDAEEVQKSLKDFMNTLSRNINIKRNYFEPLLKKAVKESILLIFSPYDFYCKEINNPERTRVSLSDLKDISKYIKVNRPLLEGLINRFEEDGIEEVFNDEGYSILNEVCEDLKSIPDDFEPYLDQFSKTLPLGLEMIYIDSEPKKSETAYFKPEEEDQKEETGEQPSQELQLVHVEPVMDIIPLSPSDEKEHLFPFSFQSDEEDFKRVSNVNKKVVESLKPIISEPKTEPLQVVSTGSGGSQVINKIDSIKKKITINQRFMFVKELFGGNTDEFNQAIDELEGLANYKSALEYLKANYVGKYNWDMESEEVGEFLEILTRRYA